MSQASTKTPTTERGHASRRPEISERFDDLTEDAKELASETGRLARESISPIEECVRQHPLQSALIAVGIGFVLGAILKSR